MPKSAAADPASGPVVDAATMVAPGAAVVDASVLVSAFLFPYSVPGEVIALAQEGRYRLVLSPILIEEVRRSLLNPRLEDAYGHSAEAVDAWCVAMEGLCDLVEELPSIAPVCRDPDDDHVIAAALAAEAAFIVTGDKDLLDLAQHDGIRIVTARAFVDAVSDPAVDSESTK